MVQDSEEFMLDDEEINLDELANALRPLSVDQLYDLGRLDIFLNETVCWVQRTPHVFILPRLSFTLSLPATLTDTEF